MRTNEGVAHLDGSGQEVEHSAGPLHILSPHACATQLHFGGGNNGVWSHFPQIIPNLIVQDIVDDLDAALEQFRLIADDLGRDISNKVRQAIVLEPGLLSL